jgi:DNA-binding winged helix-turn-helix (wHTH) protein
MERAPEPKHPTDDGFQLGRWSVNPAAGELEDGDRIVRLRPKAMALLLALARRPGELLTKKELLEGVWPDVVVGEASVSVLVGELREALGDHPESPEFIETIPRRGYRLIAPVSGVHRRAIPSRIWVMGEDLEAVLEQGENIIGRAPDAHLRIPSPKISRRHARIVVDGDTVVVEDLGSKNGTFVGDTPVNGPTPLAHGDEIRLGQLVSTLRVVMTDHESTITELSREKTASSEFKVQR